MIKLWSFQPTRAAQQVCIKREPIGPALKGQIEDSFSPSLGDPQLARRAYARPLVAVTRTAEVMGQPSRIMRNLQITQHYSDLAGKMRQVVGQEGGLSWLDWAGWASRHVGVTVRQEDFSKLAQGSLMAGLALVGGWVGAGLGAGVLAVARMLTSRSSLAMSAGNDAIFKRTTPHFARFIETFEGVEAPDPAKFKAFLHGFTPGPAEKGKDDLLIDGFTSYYRAKFETDPKKKQELVLLGNAQIVWDEQITAQDEIKQAMPPGLRHLITWFHLSLPLEDKIIKLGEDVQGLNGQMFPSTLSTIENPELLAIHQRFGVGDTTEGSAARNYADLDDRMRFILNVFRAHHLDPALTRTPYTPNQAEDIRSGHRPEGQL
ncbi:MAG: hypothetical protein AB7S38_41225 [Vulcanimicrobiota bacterium]